MSRDQNVFVVLDVIQQNLFLKIELVFVKKIQKYLICSRSRWPTNYRTDTLYAIDDIIINFVNTEDKTIGGTEPLFCNYLIEIIGENHFKTIRRHFDLNQNKQKWIRIFRESAQLIN
jgi:hypothetical protein